MKTNESETLFVYQQLSILNFERREIKPVSVFYQYKTLKQGDNVSITGIMKDWTVSSLSNSGVFINGPRGSSHMMILDVDPFDRDFSSKVYFKFNLGTLSSRVAEVIDIIPAERNPSRKYIVLNGPVRGVKMSSQSHQ